MGILLTLLIIAIFYYLCVKPSRKKAKAKKVRQNKKARKAKTNKTKTNPGVSTAVRGPALSSQPDDDYDHQRYRAYREEQAAYDDFIASLDMADDS